MSSCLPLPAALLEFTRGPCLVPPGTVQRSCLLPAACCVERGTLCLVMFGIQVREWTIAAVVSDKHCVVLGRGSKAFGTYVEFTPQRESIVIAYTRY